MRAALTKFDFRWTFLIALASFVATAFFLRGASTVDHLIAERGPTLGGQFWRLFTGPLVHATWGHLARDLALLMFVGIVFERELGRRWWLACGAGLSVPTLASFLADKNLEGFLGTSGLTHTLLGLVLVYVLRWERDADPWMRRAALVGAVLLAVKVTYEMIANAPMFPMDLGANVHQLPVAHFSGAIVGALIGVARTTDP